MKTKSIESTWGGTPFKITGTRTFARWHESPSSVFRFVGKAHDIIRLRHTGWFLDQEFQEETTHGLVFMLSHNRFLAAGSDGVSGNDDAAYFETDEAGNPVIYDDKEDAARNADRLAELYAEAESEYQARAREEMEREEMEREDQEREAQSLTEAFDFAA